MYQRRSKLKTQQYIKGNPDFYIGSDSCEVDTVFPWHLGMPQDLFLPVSHGQEVVSLLLVSLLIFEVVTSCCSLALFVPQSIKRTA
jgi:hypothetical protein